MNILERSDNANAFFFFKCHKFASGDETEADVDDAHNQSETSFPSLNLKFLKIRQ